MNNMRSLIKLRDALVESIETNPSVPSAETQFIQRLKASDRMINTRFERMQRIIRLLNAQHGVVLAAGSGNGLNAALSVLAGASEVYAVEINPARYEVAADLFARLGLSQRIHLVTEDILAVKLPENSIDGIYSLEFLEHINDSLTFYCLCYSWLRPGGRIYGRTGANGANILKRQLVYRKVWNRIDAEYACERRRMIAEAAPDLAGRDGGTLCCSNSRPSRGRHTRRGSVLPAHWRDSTMLPDGSPAAVYRRIHGAPAPSAPVDRGDETGRPSGTHTATQL